MQLHDQPVFQAHARHLDEHRRAKQLGVGLREIPGRHACEQPLGFAARQVGSRSARMTVIGRGRAGLGEHRAALAMRLQIAAPGVHVLIRQLAEALQRRGECLVVRIYHGVGTISSDHAAAPAAARDRSMRIERVDRRFGRRQHLDVEPLEQPARSELILHQLLADDVEVVVGGVGFESDLHLEHFRKDIVQPQRRGRAAKQMKPRCEHPPRSAWVSGRRAAARSDTERIEIDALAVQHAIQVVVRREQQFGRVGERLVPGEPLRIGVAVRTDDRQLGNFTVQPLRDAASCGVGGKQPVGVQLKCFCHLSYRGPMLQCIAPPLARTADCPSDCPEW